MKIAPITYYEVEADFMSLGRVPSIETLSGIRLSANSDLELAYRASNKTSGEYVFNTPANTSSIRLPICLQCVAFLCGWGASKISG